MVNYLQDPILGDKLSILLERRLIAGKNLKLNTHDGQIIAG